MPRKRRTIGRGSLAAAMLLIAALLIPAFAKGDTLGGIQLVPDTAVLLSNTTGSGGGGNGGNTSSASSATNIFSPASYVDYHEIGGEPTTVVDRYPFGPLAMPTCALAGTPSPGTNNTCAQQATCPSATPTCY